MIGSMIVIAPNGEMTKTENLAKVPDLSVLQKGVGGGFIEIVPGFTKFEGKKCIAYCNEYGRINGMKENRAATNFWRLSFPVTDEVLVGPIVILTGDNPWMRNL